MDYKKLSFELHKLLSQDNEKELCKIIGVELFNINQGITSNILQYIIKYNESLLSLFIKETKSFMKRDYFLLCNYYYNIDIEKSKYYFSLINYDKLESVDIDFLVENNMIYILELLDGIFKTQTMKNVYSEMKTSVKLYSLPKLMKNIFSIRNYDKFINFLSDKDYDIIIDAGNVIHSGYISIYKLLDILILKGYKPLVISHISHKLKGYPLIYETPKGINDDLYILTCFYYKCAEPLILTNDKYGDHISKYKLSGNLHDRLLSYVDYNIVGRNYSNCIQVTKEGIYIPFVSI